MFEWDDVRMARHFMKVDAAEKAWRAMDYALREQDELLIDKVIKVTEEKFSEGMCEETGSEWWRFESGELEIAPEGSGEYVLGIKHGAKFHLAMWAYYLLFEDSPKDTKREYQRFKLSLKYGGRYDSDLKKVGLLPAELE